MTVRDDEIARGVWKPLIEIQKVADGVQERREIIRGWREVWVAQIQAGALGGEAAGEKGDAMIWSGTPAVFEMQVIQVL
jgi:hypothetical protein